MSNYGKLQLIATAFLTCVVLSVPMWVFCVQKGAEAQRKAEDELAARTGLSHWWHEDDPKDAAYNFQFLGVVGTAASCAVGYVLSPVTLWVTGAVFGSVRGARSRASMRAADKDGERQSRQMTVSQSRQEVVMRLGSIDQFVRVYRGESDPGRRGAALQAMHGELTNLNVKMAAGELDAESLGDAQVVACVRETIADLCGAGLGDDRLTRDLLRIFSLCPA